MAVPAHQLHDPAFIEVLDRVLTKGIIITYDVDVSVAGLQLLGFDGHLTMMSLETYMKMYAPVPDGSSNDPVITAADEFLKKLPHEGPQIG